MSTNTTFFHTTLPILLQDLCLENYRCSNGHLIGPLINISIPVSCTILFRIKQYVGDFDPSGIAKGVYSFGVNLQLIE